MKIKKYFFTILVLCCFLPMGGFTQEPSSMGSTEGTCKCAAPCKCAEYPCANCKCDKPCMCAPHQGNMGSPNNPNLNPNSTNQTPTSNKLGKCPCEPKPPVQPTPPKLIA